MIIVRSCEKNYITPDNKTRVLYDNFGKQEIFEKF